MNNIHNHIINTRSDVYNGKQIDIRLLFTLVFESIPSNSYVYNVDAAKADVQFVETYSEMIETTCYYSEFNSANKNFLTYGRTYILNNRCIIQFKSEIEIAYHPDAEEFANALTRFVGQFKLKAKNNKTEVNIIIRNSSYLELKPMEIKKVKLDLGLYYEDDFNNTHETLVKRLNKSNDKGIVLLHGVPGAGKTTYLRYLVTKIRKRILFLSPSLAEGLGDPSMIELLIDNPNSVLIIEDAENIIKDRKGASNDSVSNLLNISDGMMADFLNVQLVCTFNSSLTAVDPALMRKGRLIAKYEFGKLSITKAQRLSDHFGFKARINRPMTIAEIANQHETPDVARESASIGFRPSYLEN